MGSKLSAIFRFLSQREKVETDLNAELGDHLDRLKEQYIAQGMTEADAARQAALTLGGLEPTKEQCRDARGGRWVEAFLQDIRYGVRVLLKNRGFAATAVLTLALGIGANTAIFSLVYGVLLRPLPYAQGGQLVVLHQQATKAHVPDFPFSVKEIADYREQSQTLQSVVEHHSMNFLLIGKDSAERVDTAVVSANFFDVLGVKPLLGRTFLASDEAHGADAVLILSYAYWQNHQGGDPNVVGKIFQMNNRPHTVIGVLPPIPQYPVENDVYMPTSQCPTRSSDAFIANRSARMMTAFGRLKPGVTIEQAQADLSVVAGSIEHANPGIYRQQDGYAVVGSPLRDDLTRRARTMFLVLLGVAGFVLLIACANVANLLLARLLKLERELAVRAALGASRTRLLRQVLTESLVLSVVGGLLGLALAPAALGLLVKFSQRFTERAAEIRIDAPVLLFTLFLSLATGLVFGLAPALLSRGWIGDAFKQSANWSTASRGRHRLRSALVVAQVAVSVMLLSGAGLMLRSFEKLQQVTPGFATNRLLTLRISPPFPPYNAQKVRLLADRILDKVRAVNGIESAALASSFPFNPAGLVNGPGTNGYELEGRLLTNADVEPITDVRVATAGYFETIRQPIVAGRTFADRDDHTAPGVAIINQSMVRHRFPNEDPIGKRIRFDQGGGVWSPWIEIVGIAGDVKEYGLDKPLGDEVYLSYVNGFVGRLIARTTQDPALAQAGIRAALHAIDPLVAIDKVDTVEKAEYESLTSPRVMTFLLGIFAGVAVLISTGGIAAVMALAVGERRREIGVRVALGAQSGTVLGMVLRQGLLQASAGILLGMAGAAALTQLLQSFLFSTSPTDPITFLAVPLLFLVVSAVACLIPARQVVAIDPLVALRQE
jgi:putative ABC transport system permease protein